MITRYTVIMTALLLWTLQVVHATGPEAATEELVAVIADPDRPAADRIAAERLLIGRVEEHYLLREHRSTLGRKDPEALPFVFREFKRFVYATPSGEAVMFPEVTDGQISFGVPGPAYPSSGADPERDAERLPPHAQVYYALDRVWEYLIAHATPKERRKEILISLYDEIESEHQLYRWMAAAIYNGGELVEEKLWSIFADREQSAAVRIASSTMLSRTTHRHSYTRFEHYSHRMIEYAWEERGSEVAMSFGARVSYHPLQNALLLDWYERERDPKTRRSRMSMKDVVDKIDQSFKNISGLYEQRRGTTSDKAVAIARQRMALQQEARETGDDTKLREFDAEVTEKQQAELELRIKRIDAWIAGNRDRLEQEAEAYHRERMREQQEDD